MSRLSARTAFVRGLAALLAVTSVLQPTVAIAAPADVFSSPAPVIGADPPKAADIKDGDAKVSTQTGAISWSYPIGVPPGRNGVAPGLSLSYSSQSSIFGGIAAGFAWNLGVPEIREDTSESRLKTHSFLIELFEEHPGADDRFIGLSGRRLVPVTESKAANVFQTYRAQGDDSFQRYERMLVGPPYWRVRSLDGSIMELGGPSAACSNVSEGYAPLTKSADSFGNEITYEYKEVIPGECRLTSIRWGANQAAGVADFAKVELVWNVAPSCNGIFVGSQTDYRSGTKIVSGASQLDRIRVTAFPPGQAGVPVHTREVTLEYWSEYTKCDRTHAPVRLLKSIQESAWLAGTTPVTLPAVTLEYGDPAVVMGRSDGPQQRPWAGSLMEDNLGWGYRYAKDSSQIVDRSPTVEVMFVDLDGDGLVDRLVNTSREDLDGTCRAAWQRNVGPAAGSDQPRFSGWNELVLPRLKWHGLPSWQEPPPPEGSETASLDRGEKCSLAGQVTAYSNSVAGGGCHDGTPGAPNVCRPAGDPNDMTLYCAPNGRECPATLQGAPATRTYLHYRWLDADGDGLTDLVAAVHGDIRHYDIEQGNWPVGTPPKPEPLLFEEWPECPKTTDRCKDVNPDCILRANGDLKTIKTCIEKAATIGCNEIIKAPYGSADLVDRGPYTRCEGLYPWFIYKNLGNGQFDKPTIKYQPLPLESNSGDSSLGALQVVSRTHAILDFDGDGILDAIARPRPATGNFLWVWFGDGSGGFEPTRYLFLTRPNALLSQTSLQPEVSVSTSEGLFDLNGDGLLDQWRQITNQQNASVWLNTGTEHSASTQVLTPNVPGIGVKPGDDTNHVFGPNDVTYVAPHPPANPSPKWTFWAGSTYVKNRVIDFDNDGRQVTVHRVGRRSDGVDSRRSAA